MSYHNNRETRKEDMIKEKIIKFKIPLIIIGIILVIIVSLITTKEEEFDEPVIEKEKNVKTKVKEETTIKVDLKGEVNAIGVYEMKTNERISDLINKAGGLTKNADTSLINLSKKLEDQMVIIIYSKTEVNKMKNQNKEEKITCPEVNDGCITTEKAETLLDKSSTSKETKTTSSQININTATEEELQTLSGIGESRAKAIIEYRNQKGKFEKIEDIKNVSGIGDALYEKIKSNITVWNIHASNISSIISLYHI